MTEGCAGPVGAGAISAPDPLSIGITLVVGFFLILLIAILVSFLVFRLRRQQKEKLGHPKHNGGKCLVFFFPLLFVYVICVFDFYLIK